MGYYTDFHLTIQSRMTKAEVQTILDRLNGMLFWEDFFKLLTHEKDDNVIRSVWDTYSSHSLEWDDWLKAMINLAKEYPNVEFQLEGVGEDTGDWWIALFKSDKWQIQYCQPPINYWLD